MPSSVSSWALRSPPRRAPSAAPRANDAELALRARGHEGELRLAEAAEADAARAAIHGERVGAGHLGEAAAHHADERLDLEGAVLALAEAERIPGVVVARRLDVRDAVRVAADGDRRAQGGDGDRALGGGEAGAEREAEQGGGERHGGPSLARPVWEMLAVPCARCSGSASVEKRLHRARHPAVERQHARAIVGIDGAVGEEIDGLADDLGDLDGERRREGEEAQRAEPEPQGQALRAPSRLPSA